MNATKLIDKQIADLGDPLRSEASWRGKMLTDLRKIINEADPGIKEDWKWGTAVWVNNGLVCALAAFKDHVKINFFKGAAIDDPKGLFNSGLEAKTSRSIDLFEGDTIDESALKDLIRKAVLKNSPKSK